MPEFERGVQDGDLPDGQANAAVDHRPKACQRDVHLVLTRRKGRHLKVASPICRLLVGCAGPDVAHHNSYARQYCLLRILNGSLNSAANHLCDCRAREQDDETARERGVECRATDGTRHGVPP